MTTTLVQPAPTLCDVCWAPVELTEPHRAVVAHIEREDNLGEVIVEDAEVISTAHLDCTAPVVACTRCHRSFPTYAALALHRCAELAA